MGGLIGGSTNGVVALANGRSFFSGTLPSTQGANVPFQSYALDAPDIKTNLKVPNHRGVVKSIAPNQPRTQTLYRVDVGDGIPKWSMTPPGSGLSGAAKSSTATARSLGVAGERAVGTLGIKTRIPSLTGTEKYRIPDGLSPTTLTEVKNVSRLSYTRQLRDFNLHSQKHGLRFELFTRPNTRLSGPLMDQISNGNIILRTIPH